jgi:hypothetical protein
LNSNNGRGWEKQSFENMSIEYALEFINGTLTEQRIDEMQYEMESEMNSQVSSAVDAHMLDLVHPILGTTKGLSNFREFKSKWKIFQPRPLPKLLDEKHNAAYRSQIAAIREQWENDRGGVIKNHWKELGFPDMSEQDFNAWTEDVRNLIDKLPRHWSKSVRGMADMYSLGIMNSLWSLGFKSWGTWFERESSRLRKIVGTIMSKRYVSEAEWGYFLGRLEFRSGRDKPKKGASYMYCKVHKPTPDIPNGLQLVGSLVAHILFYYPHRENLGLCQYEKCDTIFAGSTRRKSYCSENHRRYTNRMRANRRSGDQDQASAQID